MKKLTPLWQALSVLALSFIGSVLLRLVQGSAVGTLLIGLAAAVGSVFAYRALIRWTEQRRAVDELGPPGAASTLGVGALIGVTLFSLAIAVIAALGGYHVTGPGTVQGLLWYVGFMAVAAVTEELLFRGVLFRHVERRFGTWVAFVGTGALFGLSHLLNPDATLWGAIAIMLEAGGMLGAAWVATRRLWLPIGLHFGWNLAESGIFGTVVSGNGASSGLLAATTSGPTAISGGAFGPEASVVSVVLCVALAVVLLVIGRRRGNIVRLHRPRRAAAPAR